MSATRKTVTEAAEAAVDAWANEDRPELDKAMRALFVALKRAAAQPAVKCETCRGVGTVCRKDAHPAEPCNKHQVPCPLCRKAEPEAFVSGGIPEVTLTISEEEQEALFAAINPILDSSTAFNRREGLARFRSQLGHARHDVKKGPVG